MKNKEVCTIYKLTNLKNNKIYIGQTWMSVKNRMGPNGSRYKNSPFIYNAIQKYGVESFVYTTLYKAITQEEANVIEDYFIKTLKSQEPNIGYNIQNGGSNGKHSPETIKKYLNPLKVEFFLKNRVKKYQQFIRDYQNLKRKNIENKFLKQ